MSMSLLGLCCLAFTAQHCNHPVDDIALAYFYIKPSLFPTLPARPPFHPLLASRINISSGMNLTLKTSHDEAMEMDKPFSRMGLHGSMNDDAPVHDSQAQPAEEGLQALDVLANAASDEWDARNAATILLSIHQQTLGASNTASHSQAPVPNADTSTPIASVQLSTPAPASNGPVFVCGTCNASLSSKANLQRHENDVHRQLRPFQCPGCPKTFKRKSDLQAHQRKTCRPNPAPGPNANASGQ